MPEPQVSLPKAFAPFRVWAGEWIEQNHSIWDGLLNGYMQTSGDPRPLEWLYDELRLLVHPRNGAVFVALNDAGVIAGYIAVEFQDSGDGAVIRQWHKNGEMADARELHRLLLEAVMGLCRARDELPVPQLVWHSYRLDNRGRISPKVHAALAAMGFVPLHTVYYRPIGD